MPGAGSAGHDNLLVDDQVSGLDASSWPLRRPTVLKSHTPVCGSWSASMPEG
jgi:hypothetical protein